jgi:hypothetical protein
MEIDPSRIVPGMDVIAQDGERVGGVKQVRGSDVLVDRRMQRDIYVPFEAIMGVGEDGISLRYASDQIGDLGWEQPAVVRGDERADAQPDPEEIVTGSGDPAERGAWSPAADSYDLDPHDTLTTGRTTEPGVKPQPDESL